MRFLAECLRIMDLSMEKPTMYGWFHILWLVITVAVTVYLCVCRRTDPHERVRRVVFWTSVAVLLLELYKMINYSFGYEGGAITFDFQWYAFPWQFCSTPMYVGFLMGLLKKGKTHDALAAYLATYAVFAGVCVMVYPSTVFISTIGINIQTIICHGSMIAIGAYG